VRRWERRGREFSSARMPVRSSPRDAHLRGGRWRSVSVRLRSSRASGMAGAVPRTARARCDHAAKAIGTS
jgi:hypothetical protein